MDLESLAAIGEFLGGGTIIVSLILLLLNVRQNTAQLRENLKVLQRTEARAAYEQHDRYRAATLDPEVAQLWLKGLDGDLTDRADRLRFHHLMLMMTYSSENNFKVLREGLGTGWDRIAAGVAQAYVPPGGRRWWERQHDVFDPDFVRSVEGHRQSLEAT